MSLQGGHARLGGEAGAPGVDRGTHERIRIEPRACSLGGTLGLDLIAGALVNLGRNLIDAELINESLQFR
jgi:hypothetical protein